MSSILNTRDWLVRCTSARTRSIGVHVSPKSSIRSSRGASGGHPACPTITDHDRTEKETYGSLSTNGFNEAASSCERRLIRVSHAASFTAGPLHLWHCGSPADSAISTRRHLEIGTSMSQILNLSRHASDEEAHYLTSLLVYHLVERCGGQLQFTAEEVRQIRNDLSTKMVQIQLGDELRLRIIDRLPELR